MCRRSPLLCSRSNSGVAMNGCFSRRETQRKNWPMNPGFQQEYCYLAPDAAELLATEPLAMVGIDYLSVEGFQHEPRTHRALLGNSIAVVEGLRLSAIAAGDYEIVVLPLKIVGHEGAPARALLRKLS